MPVIVMDDTPYNACYEKLGWAIRKMKLKGQETVNIASRHFCALARFKVVAYEIICCEEIIQILRNAFLGICPYAQHISVAAPIMGRQPRFAKIGPNIGQEDIARFICSYSPSGRNAQ